MTAKIDAMVDAFKEMTLADLGDFRTRFEETFDVSGDAPSGVTVLTEEAAEPVEEQTQFDVTLESAGGKKIGVIKAVRELTPGLGLKEAKDLVDAAPQPVVRAVDKDKAQAVADKLRAAGATVTIS